MIDPRPSAWMCPIPGPPPWRSQPLATLVPLYLVSLSGMRMPTNKVRRIPETRPVAVRPVLFPGHGAPIGVCSRCLWAEAWKSTRTSSRETCTQGLDTLLDPLRLRSLGAALEARLSTWLPKQSQACQHVPI